MPRFHNSSSRHINSDFVVLNWDAHFPVSHIWQPTLHPETIRKHCVITSPCYILKKNWLQHNMKRIIRSQILFPFIPISSVHSSCHLRCNNNNSLWLILLSLISPLWPMMTTSHDVQVIKDTCAGKMRDRRTDRREAGGE